MRTLIIDNYDSFTYNLCDLIAQINGEAPIVVKNDQCRWEDLADLRFDNIVISPGPGSPLVRRDLGLSADAIRRSQVPLLGVCLGHQALGVLAGGTITRGPRPVHGETSLVSHDQQGIFEGIPTPFVTARYHSLVLAPPLPHDLVTTAWTEDGLVMGLASRSRPHWGVQFHPESIISEHGRRLLANFRDITRERYAADRRPVGEPTRTEAPSCNLPPVRRSPRRAFWREVAAVDAGSLFRGIFANSPAAYWLDSSSAHLGHGQWSYMGDASGPGDHSLRYFMRERRLEVATGKDVSYTSESIFDVLDSDIGPIPANPPPCPFVGGYVGCFGYELRHECGSPVTRRSNEPTALFIRSHRFLAIDHAADKIFIVAIDDPDEAPRAESWIAQMSAEIERIGGKTADDAVIAVCRGPGQSVDFRLHVPKARYLAHIEECLELIRAGETYQVCLTNEISCDTALDPMALYSELRASNPAPFSAYLKVGDHTLLSASPERFLKVDRAGNVETKPIKGTIRRDPDPASDELLRQSLRDSVKDRSENVMIVDLLRNDLSRVCEVGTVTVPHLFAVESFTTVHQLVSTVHGRLPAGKTVIDTIRATFPGGSMTGAPKIRTMEFIDQLEGRARGFYSGALGWLGDDGAADLNIVIRTIVMAEGRLRIGVGGGIVARSKPQDEYDEMLLKAKASIAAIVRAAGCDPDGYALDETGEPLEEVIGWQRAAAL